MGNKSSFHEIYKSNKDFYDKEAKKMLRDKFMEKYHIGNEIYWMYFVGMNGRIYGNTISRESTLKLKKSSEFEEYNRRIMEVAKRLKVEAWLVLELAEKYAISELESAKWKNGEILVTETFRMRVPGDFHESMYSCETSMV